MNIKKGLKVVLTIAAALIVTMAQLTMSTGKAQAGNCVPWCPDDFPGVGGRQIENNPPRGFQVYNASSKPVYVAYGYYEPGSTSASAGSYNLPMVQPSHWVATGWFKVEPGKGRYIYQSNSTGEMYFRIERNDGSAAVPRNYSHSANFCTHSQAFKSWEKKDGGQFSVSYGYIAKDRYSYNDQGATCQAAGGAWETFYKMPIQTNFTVN